MTDEQQTAGRPAGVVTWIDRALSGDAVRSATERVNEIVRGCPTTPIVNDDQALARRANFELLTDTIRAFKDAAEPVRRRLIDLKAEFDQRCRGVLGEAVERQQTASRQIGAYESAQAAKARLAAAEAVRKAAADNVGQPTATAVKAMATAARSADRAKPPAGGSRKGWEVTIVDKAAVRARLLELRDGEPGAKLRDALTLHVPTLNGMIRGPMGQEIVDAAKLPGVTVEQTTKATARRRAS